MGAVGLNFGSATSGQGFDVTSTVNQIVTNLQSVETPWKTQLTSLQSRDTALSSLGTQLATLTSDLQKLSDFNGVLASKTGSSSDTNVLQLISATSTSSSGTHTISVQGLAQTSTAATDAVGASDVLTGSITFRIGTGAWTTVQVGDDASDATLSGLSAAINAAGAGVRASVLTNADGTQRLSLISQTPGSAGQITIATAANYLESPTSLADSTTPGQNAGLGLVTIQNGTDAKFTVDGIKLTSPSNVVTGAVSGVTFQLLSSGSTGSGSEPVQVVIANDMTSIESAIQSFVSDYNSIITAINTQEGKDASGKSEPLYGTGILVQLQRGLLSAVGSSFGSGAINSLISLGMTASASADGTIAVNSGTLTDALNNKFDAIVSFFQDSGSFGAEFMKTLESAGTRSAGGAIALALKEDSRQEATLKDNIDRQETLIAVQKERLTTELNLANQILQAIPQQLNQVNEMYSAITGYSRNQNG